MAYLERDLEVTLTELDEARAKVAEGQVNEELTRERLRDVYRQIQKDLREGSSEIEGKASSLGAIAIYGQTIADHAEIVRDFVDIEQRLKGKSGQQVLCIAREEKIINCVGYGAEPEYSIDTRIVLGELNGEELIFDYSKQTCSLPTSRVAYTDKRERKIDTKISNIAIAHSDHFDFPDTFNISFYLRHTVGDYGFWGKKNSSDRLPALEIIIGNEEIELWRSTNEHEYFHGRAAVNSLDALRERLNNGQLF